MTFDITLDAKQAPVAVNNFLFLVQNEYYNGTTFHRIVTDFVDQGGSQTPDGQGSPGYKLPARTAGQRLQGRRRRDGRGPGRQHFGVAVLPRGEQERRRASSYDARPYKYSILGHMDAHGLKVAQKINTFGSATEAGTPTKTIYVFDVGIIPPQSRRPRRPRANHHHPAGHHPRAVSDAGVGSTAR